MTEASPTPPLPDLAPLPGKQTGDDVRLLVGLMQRLLAPGGCPWDREQTLTTLVPYLVEETYEVIEALESGDVDHHREELGDLLLQIVFQSELRHTEGAFGIDDVARGIVTKLVRRHPHVFADVAVDGSEAVVANWARLKAAEKAAKKKDALPSALDGIPKGAPALLRATRTGEKAGAVGFDWPDALGPRAKIDEELREFDAATAAGDRAAAERELGDVLFSVANLARKHGFDPETALRGAVERFTGRFHHVEQSARGRDMSKMTLAELDVLWDAAKRATDVVASPAPGR